MLLSNDSNEILNKSGTSLGTVTINNVSHAGSSTNVDSLINNDTGSNAYVKFTIGDKSFSKTVNNVSYATDAGTANKLSTLQNSWLEYAGYSQIRVTGGSGQLNNSFYNKYFHCLFLSDARHIYNFGIVFAGIESDDEGPTNNIYFVPTSTSWRIEINHTRYGIDSIYFKNGGTNGYFFYKQIS